LDFQENAFRKVRKAHLFGDLNSMHAWRGPAPPKKVQGQPKRRKVRPEAYMDSDSIGGLRSILVLGADLSLPGGARERET